jgi:hypothetical protein
MYACTCTSFQHLRKMLEQELVSSLGLELRESLLPYRPLLSEWMISGYCFVSTNEREILASLLAFDSLEMVANVLQVDRQAAKRIGLNIAYKLRTNQRFYTQFEQQVDSGDLEKSAFLKQSLQTALSRPLYLKLFFCGNTMAEFLANYSVQDLHRVRRFGDKGLRDLKGLLSKNNCLDLLAELPAPRRK